MLISDQIYHYHFDCKNLKEQSDRCIEEILQGHQQGLKKCSWEHRFTQATFLERVIFNRCFTIHTWFDGLITKQSWISFLTNLNLPQNALVFELNIPKLATILCLTSWQMSTFLVALIPMFSGPVIS